MTKCAPTFNGYDLSDYLTMTNELDRGIGTGRVNELLDVGKADFKQYRGHRLDSKTIPMPFKMLFNLPEKRRELAGILNVSEPVPLIFPDEPDLYYLATPDGVTGLNEQFILGSGTINWLIPDGVAHAIDSKFFTNVADGAVGKNLILDSEFDKKNKYWKPWAQLLNEKHDNSNILRGNFTDPTTADNSPTKADHWFQRNEATTRNTPEIKKGDAVSLAIDIRIMVPTTGDNNGSKTAALILEEWDRIGGTILERHTIRPSVLKTGEWQKLSLINEKIRNDKTTAINLAVGVYSDATVDISKPQLNIGSELLPYSVSATELKGTIDVINEGTYKAYPIIRARMNGENGLVAFVKDNGGILQFGNPEELDVIQGVRSDKVIDYNFRGGQPELNVNGGGVTTYPNYLKDPDRPNLVQGRIDWTKDPEAATPYFTNGDVKVWGGPRLWGDIAKNYASDNTGDFVYKNRFNFNTNVPKQGRIEFVLQNEQEVAFAMVIRDSSATKDELIVECWFGGKNYKTMNLDRNVFRFPLWEAQISRTGSKIEFKVSNIYEGSSLSSEKSGSIGPTAKTLKGITITPGGQLGTVTSNKVNSLYATYEQKFVIDMIDAADVPVTGLSTWFQRFGNTNHVLMSWLDCKFTWVNSPTYKNVPNLFDDGDLVEINVKNREVAVNGVINNQLHALGNNWEMFASETGEETIQPIASSWANMYEVEIELQEAFL